MEATRAVNCLAHSRLEYPADAEAHFDAVNDAMRPWVLNVTPMCWHGFCGPCKRSSSTPLVRTKAQRPVNLTVCFR